jgi:Papain-like cysteine protease AvrRpt2
MPLVITRGTPINIVAPLAAAPPGAPGPATNPLTVSYSPQQQNNWCWAACAEMAFHHAGVNTTVSQCDMATAQFGGSCCSAPASAACDQGNWPEYTYTHYGFGHTKQPTAISFASVQTEINANRPVQVYYAWNGGGAHVALIVGYYANGDVEVYDPWQPYGPGRRAFSYVQTAYNLGTWSITYTNLQ